jgi:hypothetical protein
MSVTDLAYDPNEGADPELQKILGLKRPDRDNVSHETSRNQHVGFVNYACEPPWWTTVFPHVLDVVRTSKTLFNAEVEVRLCKVAADGSVFTGVSEEFFFRILQRLSTAAFGTWSAVHNWKRMVEFVYGDNSRIRVAENDFAVFMKKVTVKTFTAPLTGAEFDVRVSLKTEHDAMIPPSRCTLVRIKERKSFVYKNAIVYDLTKVWTGRNEHEAVRSQPTYEIEIECIDSRCSDDYLARSLLMKTTDLLVAENTSRKRQALSDGGPPLKKLVPTLPPHLRTLEVTPVTNAELFAPPQPKTAPPPVVDQSLLSGISLLHRQIFGT